MAGLCSAGDVEDACEAVRFLWLGSQRIFFFLHASHALMMRIRWAWSRCSLVLQPREAELVTSRPSLVRMRIPGWLEKSTGCCRELEVLGFLEAERATDPASDAAGANGAGDWVQEPSDRTGEGLKLDA